MSQQLTFSWRSKPGVGILLLVIGWISIFQVIPTLHVFEVLKIGTNIEEQAIILSGLIVTTVVLMGLISSMLENLFSSNDLYSEGITKVTILLFVILITYEISYLLAVPFLTALAPFVGFDILADLTGITAFVTSIFISLFLPFLAWSFAEYIPQLNIHKKNAK